MKKKRKKKYKIRPGYGKWLFLLLLAPVAVVLLTLSVIVFYVFNEDAFRSAVKDIPDKWMELPLPEENIPLYKEAADEYGIPWTLLAAHHRIETKFSTMDPLLSPVGAEGHLQFMPCTFVGWSHPTCSDLGAGDIPETEKTDPEVISYYGGYGVDGDGDGIADPYNLADALYSAAHYLSEHGAADGELERAVFEYNRSDKYVDNVLHYQQLYEQEFETQ